MSLYTLDEEYDGRGFSKDVENGYYVEDQEVEEEVKEDAAKEGDKADPDVSIVVMKLSTLVMR